MNRRGNSYDAVPDFDTRENKVKSCTTVASLLHIILVPYPKVR